MPGRSARSLAPAGTDGGAGAQHRLHAVARDRFSGSRSGICPGTWPTIKLAAPVTSMPVRLWGARPIAWSCGRVYRCVRRRVCSICSRGKSYHTAASVIGEGSTGLTRSKIVPLLFTSGTQRSAGAGPASGRSVYVVSDSRMLGAAVLGEGVMSHRIPVANDHRCPALWAREALPPTAS